MDGSKGADGPLAGQQVQTPDDVEGQVGTTELRKSKAFSRSVR